VWIWRGSEIKNLYGWNVLQNSTYSTKSKCLSHCWVRIRAWAFTRRLNDKVSRMSNFQMSHCLHCLAKLAKHSCQWANSFYIFKYTFLSIKWVLLSKLECNFEHIALITKIFSQNLINLQLHNSRANDNAKIEHMFSVVNLFRTTKNW